jgi:ABC-type uncharacterized transport system permease subunit
MLGLGLSFVVEGLSMMKGTPWIAIGGVIISFWHMESWWPSSKNQSCLRSFQISRFDFDYLS